MANRQVLTISLPPELLEKARKIAEVEHRSMSELVREALRHYIWQANSRRLLSIGDRLIAEHGVSPDPEYWDQVVHEHRAEKGRP